MTGPAIWPGLVGADAVASGLNPGGTALQPRPRAADGSWTCFCGAQQPRVSRGCNSCGGVPQAEPARCPQCGEVARYDGAAKRCLRCFPPRPPAPPPLAPAQVRQLEDGRQVAAAEFRRARDRFARARVEVEQAARDLVQAAAALGRSTEPLGVRAAVSVFDEAMHPERDAVYAFTRSLEGAISKRPL